MRSFVHIVTVMASLASAAAAQPALPAAATLAQHAARRFPQPIAAGELVGRIVLQPLESQTILGRVTAVVRLREGGVAAVVRYGATLGIDGSALELGGRLIAVPLDAMTLLGKRMEIVDFTPGQLQAFPTFDPASAAAVPAETVLMVGLSKPSH